MAVTVLIPKPLQALTGDSHQVQVAAGTVREMISSLETTYPGMQERICDNAGKIRRHINVYVNEEDVRFLHGDETSLNDGDMVSIVPAIAGG